MITQIKKTWQRVKLRDVIEKVIDNRGKTPPLSKSGHELIETFQMSINNKYPDLTNKDKQKYVSEEIYNTWFRSGHPKEGDILFSTVGASIPQWCFVPKNSEYCIAQNLIALRPDKNKVLPEYLKSYFNQKKFIQEVKGIIIGAAQPSIKVPHLLSMEIALLSLNDQELITAILSAFDDKIELNNKISKNLEATAQAIFKEWFVNFKFPGHEKIKMVDSELGKIPEGWEVKKLADIVGLDKGISYKGSGLNKSGMPMINLGCFMRGGKFSYDNLKYYSGDYKPRHIAEIGDLLVSNTDITQEREIIGNPVIVEEWLGNKKYLFTHHIYILRPKSDLNKTFLYYLLRQSAFRARVIGAAAGTNILGLSKEAISSFEIIIPPAELVEKFTAMASQILEKISSIKHENQKLSALRDLLLPKLMSGEIKI